MLCIFYAFAVRVGWLVGCMADIVGCLAHFFTIYFFHGYWELLLCFVSSVARITKNPPTKHKPNNLNRCMIDNFFFVYPHWIHFKLCSQHNRLYVRFNCLMEYSAILRQHHNCFNIFFCFFFFGVFELRLIFDFPKKSATLLKVHLI